MKLLLIRRENVCYGSLDSFLEGIKGGFEECGADVDVLDVSNNPLELPDELVLQEISEKGYNAVMTFNAVGQQNYLTDGVNLWDQIGVPFYNYIVDHPLQHKNAMTEHGNNYHVICVDKDHSDFIRKYYPEIKSSYFVPLGGMDSSDKRNSEDSLEEYVTRKNDILFTGTFIPLFSIEERINEYPASVRNLIFDHIEFMLDNRSLTEEEGLIHILKDKGVNPEEINLTGYLFATKLTEEYVKSFLREETVRYMIESGLNMRIFGNGWDRFEADMNNTVCYPGVAYEKMSELYYDSKIVLGQSSHFKYGMHDRIPTAMIAGAAVLTDGNDYLKSVFTDGVKNGELCMYDISMPNEVPQIAYGMLADLESLYKMTKRAKSKALSEFTWRIRAKEVLNIMGM